MVMGNSSYKCYHLLHGTAINTLFQGFDASAETRRGNLDAPDFGIVLQL